MPANRPQLAVLLLATAVITVLLAASARPAAADKHGGGRMVIIRAPGTRAVAAPGGARSKWRDRRLEDEVAPEFSGLLGSDQRYISYHALNDPNRQACSADHCAAKGDSYTRPCKYKDQCRGG